MSCALLFGATAQAQTRFRDLGRDHWPRGPLDAWDVILVDVDNDRDLDAVVTGGDWLFGTPALPHVFLNDGRGVFAEVSGRLPAYVQLFQSTLAAGDVDGDGSQDLLLGIPLSGQAGRLGNLLLLNNGQGTFQDVTTTHLPRTGGWTFCVGMTDLDGDTDLDIFVGSYGSTLLYVNDGTGRFTDATAANLPAQTEDLVSAVVMADFDGDGDRDLFLGVHGAVTAGQSRLLLNNGRGVFTEVTSTHLPVHYDATVALAVADVDRDGDSDVLLANEQGQNRLFLNNGRGVFVDATAARLPAGVLDTQGIAAVDLDGDGAVEVVLAVVGPDRCYRNDGRGFFTDVTATVFPADTDTSTAAVAGDVDGTATSTSCSPTPAAAPGAPSRRSCT